MKESLMQPTEITLSLPNGRMTCITFGEGRKSFVMIAGMSMAGLTGLAEPIAAAYQCFHAEYAVTVLDRVDPLPDGWTVRDMAADAAAAMRELGIEGAAVMGASQGGMIAQLLAIDHPELVRALILCSSCAYQNETGRETFRVWEEMARQRDGRAIYRDFFRRVYSAPNADALAAMENTADDAQCRRFGILAKACTNFDARAELDGIRCPVLVLGSEEDHVLGGESSPDLAARLHCPLYLYRGFGHAVCDESPDVPPRMLDFLHSVNA